MGVPFRGFGDESWAMFRFAMAIVAMVILSRASVARATLALYESFNYPSGTGLDGNEGAAISAGGQTAPNGNKWYPAGYNTQTVYNALVGIAVVHENLTTPGLKSPVGNAIVFGGAGYDARLGLGTLPTSGSLFASYAFRIDDITGLGDGGGPIAGFNTTRGPNSGAPTILISSLWIRPTADASDDPENYNIGISKTNSAADVTWDSMIYTASFAASPHFAVVSYGFVPGGIFGSPPNDVSALYLDPSASTFGGPTPGSGTILSTTAGDDLTQAVLSFVLPQYNAAETPVSMEFDELRVGTSYSDVTPAPEPATFGLLIAGASICFMGRNRGRRSRTGK
jgi:hypothetical protein